MRVHFLCEAFKVEFLDEISGDLGEAPKTTEEWLKVLQKQEILHNFDPVVTSLSPE